MKIDFNIIEDRPATKKRPKVAIIEVVCESKEILGLGVITFGPMKGKLAIYYREIK